MNKKELNKLDLNIYSEVLDNGLEVYIVPNDKVKNTYATYSSRYGGIHNDFIPYNEKEMITVPKGIAHFLEHKMFEQKDGSDAFTFFSKNGSDANAFTSARKTSYIFSGSNGFYENLEFLLSYVEDPYFTDQNVEKEKGIIIEEIHMNDDKPYSRMYRGLLYNAFINHPIKYPTIGTDDSVRSITKEDLYKCYNTFYHPSNMFLVVTGNVDPDKTIELIRKHENSRNLSKEQRITLKTFDEPDNVERKEETINMDITIPKIGIAFKINIKDINKPKERVYSCLLNSFALKLDSTSLFDERLQKEGLLNEEVDITGIDCDDHILVIVAAETNKPKEVINAILNEVKDLNITEEELERRKRAGISSLVMSSDSIFKLNTMIMENLIALNHIDYDPIGSIKSYTTLEYKEVLSKVNLDNYTIFEIDPLKED